MSNVIENIKRKDPKLADFELIKRESIWNGPNWVNALKVLGPR